MQPEDLKELIVGALDDLKAQDVTVLDVHEKTPITDFMVIATGTSNRHVKSLADSVVKKLKDSGVKPSGVEGEEGAEWILVDAGDVVVHVMLPRVRDFYNLEKLWSLQGEELEESPLLQIRRSRT
ncbi:MAG: ribosome silencing factor [Gammaproteobacteria bacterium]|jgi:ribosome-associated protein